MTEEPSGPPGPPPEGAAPEARDELADLRAIAAGTARSPGAEFFPSLVRHLALAVQVPYTFVAAFTDLSTRSRVHTLAYWARDHLHENHEFDLAGTPGQDVVRGNLCHHSEGVREKFPGDRSLIELGIESYLGVPLLDRAGQVLGQLAVLDERPMPPEPRRLLLCQIFAARAAAELERLRAESERARLEQQNLYLREEIKEEHNFEEIIGQGPALRAVLDKVRLVAGTDTTVLVCGETGTGKELIARAVHAHSKRKERPLIKVNCAALPPGQLESELFGHEQGPRRIGRFELADGGTLFLDEVSAVPLEVQGKLLRVLQEGEFERVGGNVTLEVDVRVIAATNRDLRRAVREKTFREDLYHRLNVFPIQLPPLRDRREDIPLLTPFLVSRLATRIGKRIEGVGPETMARLTNYPWPGNVGELENVLERAILLSPVPLLEIGPEVLSAASALPAMAVAPEPYDLATVERNHIRTVLERTRWVIDGPHGAARVLGLHPNTLRSRLKKLGLQRPSRDDS